MRLNHLNKIGTVHSMDEDAFTQWSTTRLNRELSDYLIREAYLDTAQALIQGEGLQV